MDLSPWRQFNLSMANIVRNHALSPILRSQTNDNGCQHKTFALNSRVETELSAFDGLYAAPGRAHCDATDLE